MSTLAEYNNNPGNLRPPKGVKYDGQIGVDEKGFAIFENAEYGRRALLNDINIKLKRGLNTPDKFLEVYAPRGEENPDEARDNYRILLAQSLGLESTSTPFPKDSAERIADAITKFEGGTWGKPPAKSAEGVGQGSDETKEPSLKEKAGKLFEDAKGVAAQAAEEYPEAVRAGIDVGGALAGRKLSVLGEGLRREYEAQSARTPPAQPRAAASSAAPAGQPPPPIPTDPMHTRQLQGTTDQGATGRARQTTYNEATARQAAAADEQARVIEELRRRGVVSGDSRSVVSRMPGMTSTPSGVMLPSGQVYADIPPTQGTSAPPPQPQPRAPLSARASRAMNVGARVMPGAFGLLGGLGAAELGQEAYGRAQEGDIPGALIAGAGAAGSLASALPFPQTRVGGPAIAAASPLTLYLYDKAKERAVSQAQGYGALAAGRQLPAPSIYQGYFGP